MLTNLCHIAKDCGTDKFGQGYTPFYDLLFRYQRERVGKVLEIGIGYPACMQHVKGYKAGASLRMWEEYFPNAEIYGLDINPDALVNEGRIHSAQCDSRSPAQVKAVMDRWGTGAGYDLILDDGSHDSSSQVIAATTLVPYLRRGGVYIIEDVGSPLEVSVKLPYEHSVVTFQQDATARRDCLILIQQQEI